MKASHLGQLPTPYAKLQLYADLSQYTTKASTKTITKPLNNHMILYQWGFPTKKMVTENGVKHNIFTVEEGLQLLHTWGIIPDPPTSTQSNRRENNQPSYGSYQASSHKPMPEKLLQSIIQYSSTFRLDALLIANSLTNLYPITTQ